MIDAFIANDELAMIQYRPPPWARHTGRARRAADVGNRFGTLHEASVALFGG